jgi:branched-chain amino acid transport system permease protein
MVLLFGPEIVQNGIHLSVWFIVPLGGVLTAFFGALLGAPAMKLRGDYLVPDRKPPLFFKIDDFHRQEY